MLLAALSLSVPLTNLVRFAVDYLFFWHRLSGVGSVLVNQLSRKTLLAVVSTE